MCDRNICDREILHLLEADHYSDEEYSSGEDTEEGPDFWSEESEGSYECESASDDGKQECPSAKESSKFAQCLTTKIE